MGAAAGVKNGDLSTATYKAFGRVTPTDYFDGEEPAKQPTAINTQVLVASITPKG